MSFLIRQFVTKISAINTANTIKYVTKPHSLRTISFSNKFFSNEPVPHEVVDLKADKLHQNELIKNINDQIANSKQGRLFAIVHIAGKQFKITEGDVVIIEGYWPPNIGDKLKLDKVLLLGAKDFTLVGKPLVEDGLVNINATVIEKTLSHTKTNFKKKRRKQYTNINFYRIQQTALRINTIEVAGKLNSPPEVSGLEHKIL